MNAPQTLTALSLALSLPAIAETPKFLDHFNVAKSDLASAGKSEYFNLEPGSVSTFEGDEDGKATVLTITVTGETKTVDGVETRVVEEKETAGGETKEISRNYFAISKATGRSSTLLRQRRLLILIKRVRYPITKAPGSLASPGRGSAWVFPESRKSAMPTTRNWHPKSRWIGPKS